MLKIATIIVTYNAQKWIDSCLTAVKNALYHSDIFLVDNASTDDTLKSIKKNDYKEVIALKKNTGFGFGNNLALKKALALNYDYYFLINQDVFVAPETLTQLVDFATQNKDFGIVCPIQYNGKGEEVDFLFKSYIAEATEKEDYYQAIFVNAAAWLVSKECLEAVGLFHPLFSHYGEDKNYCNRALFHGFKIAILKNTKVLHDRTQNQTLQKAIHLAKIKLLTFFLNPNFSNSKSFLEGIKGVLGISKYLMKKYRTILALKSLTILLKEYLKLLLNFSKLNREKEQSKIPFYKL